MIGSLLVKLELIGWAVQLCPLCGFVQADWERMNHWMNDTKLEIETFVLKGTGVTFPELFAEHHDEHLVSISANPAEAAHWWHWQSDKSLPGEGWVSFIPNGAQIMPMDAWTNVDVFWQELLNALESYVSTGRGQGEFSEETATFSLAKREMIAVFELRGQRYPVEPDSFLKAVLGAAREFFTWVEEYIGGIDKTYLVRIETLMDGLK